MTRYPFSLMCGRFANYHSTIQRYELSYDTWHNSLISRPRLPFYYGPHGFTWLSQHLQTAEEAPRLGGDELASFGHLINRIAADNLISRRKDVLRRNLHLSLSFCPFWKLRKGWANLPLLMPADFACKRVCVHDPQSLYGAAGAGNTILEFCAKPCPQYCICVRPSTLGSLGK